MSLSQFVYNLAGIEDQIPESQLASSTDTPEKSTAANAAISNGLPPATSSGGLSFQDHPDSGKSIDRVSLQQREESVSPRPNVEPTDPVSEGAPETPTSILGYFFGGTTESPPVEASPATEKLVHVPPPQSSGSTKVVEAPPVEDPGFGSFLWTLVAGEEDETEQPEVLQSTGVVNDNRLIEEEQPQKDAPEPSYTAKKLSSVPAPGFTDSDAEYLVQRVEQGGEMTTNISGGETTRKSIMSDMEIKMKLNEAKVSLRKLKEIQKQTNDILGIEARHLVVHNYKDRASTDPNASAAKSSSQEPVNSLAPTKKFVSRKTKPHVQYKSKLVFTSLNAPISDRLKAFPPSLAGPLHSRQPMPINLSGNFPRDVVVVSSVEARSLRQTYQFIMITVHGRSLVLCLTQF
jgi:hypothetical protein